jgi:phosphoribosylformylglycinamidine synthase
MPNTQVQQPVQTPSPATITPELLKQHSITPDEYKKL